MSTAARERPAQDASVTAADRRIPGAMVAMDVRRTSSEDGHGRVDADPGLDPGAVGGGGLRRNAALRHGGSRVPVTPTAAGWVIQSATGQGVVVDSTTALWTALLSRSEVPVDVLLALPARPQPPGATAAPVVVAVAVAAAPAADAPSRRPP